MQGHRIQLAGAILVCTHTYVPVQQSRQGEELGAACGPCQHQPTNGNQEFVTAGQVTGRALLPITYCLPVHYFQQHVEWMMGHIFEATLTLMNQDMKQISLFEFVDKDLVKKANLIEAPMAYVQKAGQEMHQVILLDLDLEIMKTLFSTQESSAAIEGLCAAFPPMMETMAEGEQEEDRPLWRSILAYWWI